jgi:hypothetical protein
MQVVDSKTHLNQMRMKANTLSARIAWWTPAFLLFVLLAVPAHAQFRTSIQGVVTDPNGALVSGATLTLKDMATNETVVRTSDDSGIFNFNALPADRFTLVVEKQGFKKKVLTDLQLIPEQPNALNIQLELGDVTQTVSVNASQTPSMDTSTANIGSTVSSNDIDHMPAFQRDIFTLVQLAPGAVSDGSQGGGGGTYNTTSTGWEGPNGTGNNGQAPTENGILANANGGEYSTNSVTIDGINVVSAVWGGTSIITPDPDSVASVRIVTNSYDAENDRFSGAHVVVTSKSGTNQIHGSLFYGAHRPGLNASQHVIVEPDIPGGTYPNKDTQDFSQYGGSVGGPIWKNKVFAFFDFETVPNHSNSVGTNWYDTAALDALVPSGSLAKTYLTYPGSAVASTGTVTATCAALGLVSGTNCQEVTGGLNIGSPLTSTLGHQDLTALNTITSPGIGNGLSTTADIADYVTSTPSTSYYRAWNGRLDADVTSKDRLAFAIYWIPQGSTFYNGPARAYDFFHHDQVNQATSLIWNHTFTPTLLNEARANVAGWRWNELTENPQRPVGLPQDNINVLPIQTFGAGAGSHLNQWTYGYKDVLTKVLKRHTIKAGGEFTRLYYLNDFINAPSYNFFDIWDFMNDAPMAEGGDFNASTGFPNELRDDDRQSLFGLFVQDEWKVRPNLTINAGLRYSYFGSLYSKEGNIGVSSFGSGAAFLTGITIKAGGNLWVPQKGNFGPQLGFNWSPDRFKSKMVVRGGIGLAFNQEDIALSANSANNPPTGAYYNFGNSTPPNTIDSRIVYGLSSSPTSLSGFPENPNTITTYNTANLPVNGGATVTAYPGSIPTKYSTHYSLEVDYTVGPQWVATLGYEGSETRHTIAEIRNYNAVAAIQGLAMNPLLPDVDYYANGGSGNNNSMLAEMKHQFAHHFSADAQFMWARSMDNATGPYQYTPYLFNAHTEYGRSDFDVRRSLKLIAVWQPVIFHGSQNWMEKAVGGWSLSGIANFHTGFGWTPNFGTGNNLYCNTCGNYQTLRPSYTGGAGTSTSNAAFESGSNFANILTGQTTTTATVNGNAGTVVAYSNKYFNVPNFQNAITFGTPPPTPAGAPVANIAMPAAPGLARNSFVGPGYKDLDASLTKAFGLPNMRVLGDNAKLEIRADFFNLFNNTNLDARAIQSNITATNFGQDTTILGSRTVSFQARFAF